MMDHVLDRPAWHALNGPHAALSQGGMDARRYRRGTVPFAAARHVSNDGLAGLAALAPSGDTMVLVESNLLTTPPGLATVKADTAVQMVLAKTPATAHDIRVVPLAWADAQEMLALATLTEPGPFTLRAQALGTFHGIRVAGQLVAMAGQRMKQNGFTELSGVCTHPNVRGRGLARLLSIHVIHLMLERGETPYLHAWTRNTPAIRLYESIGFRPRAIMNVTVLQKP